ncbi:NitT/TauT family transport system substrate-binding protein [Bacillus sp. UNCCL13]|nr:NitT/TauT family transport system substrate-binding protein [Bacillus sp. UNCCL13]
MKENPELVQKIIDAHKEAVDFILKNPEEAKEITIKDIKDVTGQELKKSVMDKAWNRIGFTYEVDEEAIQAFSDSSYALKFLKDKPAFDKLIDKQFIN